MLAYQKLFRHLYQNNEVPLSCTFRYGDAMAFMYGAKWFLPISKTPMKNTYDYIVL